LFKLLHILISNRINYVLYDGINFKSNKSLDFVKLMLESLNFFIKIVVLIRTIKLTLLITKLHSKGLKRIIGDVSAKYIYIYLMFLIGF